MAETILKQGFNKVTVEGLVKEIKFDIKKEGTPDEIMIGEIDIQTDETSSHTFKAISKKFKKDGTPNKIFTSLLTIKNDYKSIAEHGKESADKVRINRGELGLNEYFGQDGNLKSFPQLRTNFVNRLTSKDTFTPQSKFEVEVLVDRVVMEVKNEEETGRAVLHAYIPVFGGKIIPFQFVVEGEQKVDYVVDNYQKGMTVKLFGVIINSVSVKKVTKEVAFGEPQEEVYETTIREYSITGGTEPYDEDASGRIDPSLVTKALQQRENYLEELKNKKSSSKPANTSSQGKDNMAFGGEAGGSQTSPKPTEDDDDLPF